MLEMITLGEYSSWMTRELENEFSPETYKAKIGDYFAINENRLVNEFPIIVTIIKDMLTSAEKRKTL
jgi:hypothetical protein